MVSIGLGGGSIVRKQPDGSVTVGPDSVGYQITEKALCFGGDVCTATDIAVRLGMTELGMVYQFGLYSGDQLREGTFALDLYNRDYGELTITPISGVNLFDAPEGGCTVFSRL